MREATGAREGQAYLDTVVILTAAFLVCIPSLFNGFPFIFIDTSDYIILTPRLYRSPFYQLFVFLTGFQISLWGVVAVQAVLATHLAYLVFCSFADRRLFLAAVAVLAIASSLPVFVGFVMPDIFTGIMFLAIYLLCFEWGRLGTLTRAYLFGVLVVAISVHLSHLLMAVGMTLFSAGLGFWQSKPTRAVRPGVLVAAAACGLAALASVGYNKAVFGRAELSPAGQSFLLANLVGYGPARDELRETCPGAGYRLCAYQADLPANADLLLWRPGPFVALGGFEAMREESAAIVRATLRDRPGSVLIVVGQNFFRALTTLAPAANIRPLAGAGEDTAPRIAALIGKVYGAGDEIAFTASRQSRDTWPVAEMNVVGIAVVALSALIILGQIVLGWRRDRNFSVLALYMAAAYCGSSLICSALSGVHDRYQARVTWPLVLVALMVVARQLDRLRRRDAASDLAVAAR
ncbi:hypothetical protein [Bradyrhizobium sp.]|uniref:hypothetical protein n=1 Tax=Bradyrhizobium sp. TaxID=376 RepID=UPI001ECCBE10|nr:hypothetical protein [Bradyrhizobium sp.]MBV9980581.1 hypothetical protein [Bradyrhizobium sp.]